MPREKILACSEQRFNRVHREDTQLFNEFADDRANIISDVSLILNTPIWLKLNDITDDEVILEKQLSAVKRVCQRYPQKA